MIVLHAVSLFPVALGCGFMLAGSLGMLRFPDALTRLHATTKADNLGLGLVLLGLALHTGSALVAAKLLLIWLLAMASGSTASHLIARTALEQGAQPRNDD